MPKARVMVVDDSLVVRRMVSDAINLDPQLEVVGAAANGKLALQRIPQVHPDVIILDVDMPEMDGIATLREVRKLYPKLPVIMFSALTEKGAETAIDALVNGASDCLGKPNDLTGLEDGVRWLQRELVPKIKAHCRHVLPPDVIAAPAPALMSAPPKVQAARPPVELRPRPARSRIEVVAIGVSTGGPQALVNIFSKITQTLPVPIVVVQHMPPLFTKRLADSLNTLKSGMVFHEGAEGMLLEPGHAYVAPGGRHMVVRRVGTMALLHLNDEPPENSCRPAVDVLYRSIARVYGGSALAVILTGMGMDGLRGCEAIRPTGGRILAQDEASSVVWGMPGFVVKGGLADEVLPLDQIAGRICQLVSSFGLSFGPPRTAPT